MKCEIMEYNTAKMLGLQLPFAFIREMSSVAFGQTPPDVDDETLLEARFFDGTQEIRLSKRAGEAEACRLTFEAEEPMRRTCKIVNPAFGHRFTAGDILAYDEDGQAYIATTVLLNWEGGVDNG